MTPIDENDDVCRHHSGVKVRLDHLEAVAKKNREDIDGMKKLLIYALASIILTLFASAANLLLRVTNVLGQ